MTTLPIADRWFELKRISDDITLLWEPHVVPLMRCNIWHVRGRDRDLMIDTGMGIASLQDAAKHLLQKNVTAVATKRRVAGKFKFKNNAATSDNANVNTNAITCSVCAMISGNVRPVR